MRGRRTGYVKLKVLVGGNAMEKIIREYSGMITALPVIGMLMYIFANIVAVVMA